MTKSHERTVTEFVRLMDIVTLFASFYIAYWIRDSREIIGFLNGVLGRYMAQPMTLNFEIENLEQILFLIVPLWLFLLSYAHTYDFERTSTFYKTIRDLLKVHIIGGLTLGTYIFFTNAFQYKRSFFFLFIVLSFFFILIVRFAVQMGLRFLRSRGRNRNRAVIIGGGKKAFHVLSELRSHPYWGFTIVGIVTGRQLKEESVLGLRVLGTLDNLGAILRNRPVDDVFVAVDEGDYVELKSVLRTCENIGITVHMIPDKYDLEIAKSTIGSLGSLEFVSFSTVKNNLAQLFVKRGMDIFISLMLLPLLVLAYVVIGIIIKLDSQGPVLYKSYRMTRNRRMFVFYKFRTMEKGAEEKFELVSMHNEMEGPIAKIKDDPRVTNVGKFLRKYSIDELPQVINVLMGDMSLVGPRPPTPEEVEHYSMSQLRKLSMQQGITGLWQVSGRDNVVRFEDRLRLDLEYIDNWSLWLDIKILLKTFFIVFKGAM